jgi:hypothetical protein
MVVAPVREGGRMSSTVHLDAPSVEAIALRVVELLGGEAPNPASKMIGTAEVARRLNVSPDYVRQHRDELGGVPLGDGPKPRLRFDSARVDQWLAARSASPAKPPSTPGKSRPRRASERELLPIRAPK